MGDPSSKSIDKLPRMIKIINSFNLSGKSAFILLYIVTILKYIDNDIKNANIITDELFSTPIPAPIKNAVMAIKIIEIT